MSVPRYLIRTGRLEIRPVDLSMVEEITQVVVESRDHISRWMRWAADATVEAERAFVESAGRAWDADLAWAFMFFHEGRLAGGTGLTRHGFAYLRKAEMGYWIHKDLGGRGLTTESAAAVAHFGFEILGLHRLELHASPGNEASHRIAEKIGFQKEGYHRDSTVNRDGFLDTESYALLETDPRPIPDPIAFEPLGGRVFALAEAGIGPGTPEPRDMKKIAVLIALALMITPLSAGADVKLKRLGEDPVGDAPAGLDLTYVEAGKNGADLEIRIGVDGMTPGIGGYPLLPGIEWQFSTGKKHYLAEAYIDAGEPGFLLFEILEDSFKQIAEIEGTYSWTDGYISMLVPLKTIEAKKGTKIRAAVAEGDADSHVHLGTITEYPDYLTTTKAFVVP